MEQAIDLGLVRVTGPDSDQVTPRNAPRAQAFPVARQNRPDQMEMSPTAGVQYHVLHYKPEADHRATH